MPLPAGSLACWSMKRVRHLVPLWWWPPCVASLCEIRLRCILRPIGRNKMAAETTKSARGEATRRRIVEQSAAVFNRRGYSGTSMSELMAATGLEKGGLYRHFASKEDLAAAAFDYAWETVSEPRWRGLEDCGSSLEKLLLLVKNFLEHPPRTLPPTSPLL